MPTTPPPLTPDPASPAAPGEFRIEASREILDLLRSLEQERGRLVLSCPAGVSVQTRLCSVSEDHKVLGLELPPQDAQLQTLLGADEISAVAYLDKIRLEFEVEGLMLVQTSGPGGPPGAVLRCLRPSRLYRFQRRQAFRVRPSSRLPQARFIDPQRPGQETVLRILDLSVGGVGLQLPEALEAPAVGSLLSPVSLELDRQTRLQVSLRVQHLRQHADGTRQLGLTFEALEPAASRDLQYYIDQTQKLSRLLRHKVLSS